MRSLSASTVLVLSYVVTCHGLASNNNPVQNLVSRVTGRKPSKGPARRGEELLQQLNLQASREPKLAAVRVQQIPNLLTATVPAILRVGSGVFAQDYKIAIVPRDDKKYTYYAITNDQQLEETGIFKPPAEPIILYEFESCPFCRKVREACSILSLSVTFRPTPRNGRTFRPEIKTKYGSKATFPYMIDPNTGVTMFQSDDIIKYLFKLYGNGNVPWTLRGDNNPWVIVSGGLGVGLARWGAGGGYRESKPPSVPLVLWAYEGSPYCKVVRETLCSLEIPHTVNFTPRGSMNRQKLWQKTGGRFQVPYLEDPNTDVTLFECEAINEYLEKQYGIAQSPVQYL